eukprot:Skav235567  [mRNA]  locus=scaffold612:6501:9648:+ [translate_table: standard]
MLMARLLIASAVAVGALCAVDPVGPVDARCENESLAILQLRRCSPEGQNCLSTGCCTDEGYKCYEKDQYWSGCRPSCQPGQPAPTDPPEYRTPWSCSVVGCSTLQEDCRSSGCCADESYTCYEKNSDWAGCRQSCEANQVNPYDPPDQQTPWSCIDQNDPPEYQTPWSCEIVPRPNPSDPYATLPKFPGEFYVTASAGSGRSRIYQFIDSLTDQPVYGSAARAVHSSGGAAGGIVSEGQGYGLLLTGSFLAAITPDDRDWNQMMDYTYQMFLGWKRMCEYSGQGSCQEEAGFLCQGHPCLPHWKFADDLTTVLETGSAPDGDEDAMTGMLLAVMAVERTSPTNPPKWLQEVGEWAYATCQQFFLSETLASPSGRYRIVKLGACWGGWGDEGQNPSYHAPAAYRLCQRFQEEYADKYGALNSTALSNDHLDWQKVIDTTYQVFEAVECHTNGLITNWARVYEEGDHLFADAYFTGSGTPGTQYGAEAARTSWRVALDYLLFPGDAAALAKAYLDPLVAMLYTKEQHCEWSLALRVDNRCLVTSVHGNWSKNMFMAGGTFSSLVCPNDSVQRLRQQELINAGGALIASGGMEDYYSGSWVAISTYTLDGGFIRAASNAGLYEGVTPPPSPPPSPSQCSSTLEDCRKTKCCNDAGHTCYEKDQYWAGCRESCQPNQVNPDDPEEYRTPWTCQPVSLISANVTRKPPADAATAPKAEIVVMEDLGYWEKGGNQLDGGPLVRSSGCPIGRKAQEEAQPMEQAAMAADA